MGLLRKIIRFLSDDSLRPEPDLRLSRDVYPYYPLTRALVEKFADAARVLIDCANDLDACKDELFDDGVDSPQLLRINALIPVACRRRVFQARQPAVAYSNIYVVTCFGRAKVEIAYSACGLYAGIERAVDDTAPLMIATLGAFSCETQAINDALNKLREAGLRVTPGAIRLCPTEVLA